MVKFSLKKTWKCRRNGCKFESESKFLFKAHQKKSCAFKKRKNNVFSTKKDFSEIDFTKAKIGEKIGSGAFGNVFESKVEKLVMVAKFVEIKESFQAEKKTYEKLQKDFIKKGFPRYFGSLESNGTNVIFIEKLEFTLETFFRKVYHQLTKKSVAQIMIDIIEKVGTLHECGFVHRDLKLNNFMMKNGVIYVTDFGTSREFPKLPKKGSVNGSIRYLSLDAHKFQLQTYKDDLESIGWLFLELTTENLPWKHVCQLYRENKIPFGEATEQVLKMKEMFLKTEKTNFYIIEYIKAASNLPFERNEYVLSGLKQIVNKFIIESNIKDQKWWEMFTLSEEKKHDQIWSPLLKNKPTFTVTAFDESILSSDLVKKYIKKEMISCFEIIDELERTYNAKIGKHYNYCDLTKSTSFMEKATENVAYLWLLFSNEEEIGPHFSSCISKSGQILSFNGGENLEPEEVLKFKIKNWKYVTRQDDNWSCGYRALFWMMQVLETERVEQWLVKNEVVM